MLVSQVSNGINKDGLANADSGTINQKLADAKADKFGFMESTGLGAAGISHPEAQRTAGNAQKLEASSFGGDGRKTVGFIKSMDNTPASKLDFNQMVESGTAQKLATLQQKDPAAYNKVINDPAACKDMASLNHAADGAAPAPQAAATQVATTQAPAAHARHAEKSAAHETAPPPPATAADTIAAAAPPAPAVAAAAPNVATPTTPASPAAASNPMPGGAAGLIGMVAGIEAFHDLGSSGPGGGFGQIMQGFAHGGGGQFMAEIKAVLEQFMSGGAIGSIGNSRMLAGVGESLGIKAAPDITAFNPAGEVVQPASAQVAPALASVAPSMPPAMPAPSFG